MKLYLRGVGGGISIGNLQREGCILRKVRRDLISEGAEKKIIRSNVTFKTANLGYNARVFHYLPVILSVSAVDVKRDTCVNHGSGVYTSE